MLKLCYSALDTFVRYPWTCIVGFLMGLLLVLVMLEGCEAPDNDGCPDGICPMQQERQNGLNHNTPWGCD